MKKLLSTICLVFVPLFGFATPYENDKTNYFVSGAGANEALEMVNQIICFLNNTNQDEFVNDGAYKATIYVDDCKTVSSDSSSASNATPQSSSSSGGASTATTVESKTGSTAILNVTRGDGENDPVITKGWFALIMNEEMGPEEKVEMKITVYIDLIQTAGQSEDSPRGDWTMRYSMAATEDIDFGRGMELPAGTPMGLGYIDSSGRSLRFKDNGMNGNENVIANFAVDGGIEGIYMDEVFTGGFGEGSGGGGDQQEGGGGDQEEGGGSDQEEGGEMNMGGNAIFVQNGFVIDATSKLFCKKLIKAETIDFGGSKMDGNTFAPERTEYTPESGDGVVTDEMCYSTDVDKAYRNVWRYGVYDASGDRYELANQSFPLRATVNAGTPQQREIFAYAGYWGVHVDPESIGLLESDTLFKKENFTGGAGEGNDNAPTFTLKTKNTRLEKREKQYVSLNSLNGLSLGFHMGGDAYWNTELAALNPALVDQSTYQEYEGTFISATQTFSLTDGVKFQPRYEKTALETPIEFTTAQWLATVQKTVGEGENWEHLQYGQLHAWSHDTHQGYNITSQAMNNPTDATAPDERGHDDPDSGVSSEITTVVNDLSEIAGGLKCLTRCPTAALLSATFTDVLTRAAAALEAGTRISYTDTVTPSPYATAGPYVEETVTKTINNCPEQAEPCNEERTYQKGQWIDGMLASEITSYEVVSDVIQQGGTDITSGVAPTLKTLMSAGTIRDAYTYFQGAQFTTRDGWSQDLSWGVMSGPLILASDLSKLECDKRDETTYEGQTPPEFTDEEALLTRYCADKLHSDKTLVTYNMMIEVQPSYEIFDSGNNKVAFDPPKVLYYQVPDGLAYGDDAGKDLRLDYNGFGELHGIPGEVINIQTGESFGQYYDGGWDDNLRYLSRFTIPNGGEIRDKTTGTIYKVKALNGEEYLSLAPTAIGTLEYVSTSDDLIADEMMIDVGPSGGDNYIGVTPTELLNDGDASVIHGETLFDPSTNSAVE